VDVTDTKCYSRKCRSNIPVPLATALPNFTAETAQELLQIHGWGAQSFDPILNGTLTNVTCMANVINRYTDAIFIKNRKEKRGEDKTEEVTGTVHHDEEDKHKSKMSYGWQ